MRGCSGHWLMLSSIPWPLPTQFSSAESCPTLCNPMNHSTPAVSSSVTPFSSPLDASKLSSVVATKDVFSSVQFSSVSQSCPTLQPHESQHTRSPCLSPTPGVYSNSCPSSRWCHPAISSSVIPFSSCPQSLPGSGSFPMSQLFSSGGQSMASTSPSNEHPGLISFRIDWLDLLAVQGTLKSHLQHQSSKASIFHHNKLWKILQEMGIPDHLTCLLRNLYAGQEATVRTGHGTTDWFQIRKGLCKGCILSPWLFNFYAEYIMRNSGLEEAQAGIKIAGRNINNLRYADDTTLMAESEEELKSFLMKVKEESEKVGLKFNIQKTKIMASSLIISWQIDGETGETVSDFIFLGSKITADGDCSHEIKRRLLLGRKSMTNLDSILKSRDITLPTKVRLSQSYGFSSSHV